MASTAYESILSYYDAIRADLRDGMQRAADYFAVEGIHDLRVATKKMRSLFRLVEFIQPEFNARAERKPLKSLYGVAGQLRDVDIQQEIVLDGLMRYQISEYANELKEIEFAVRPAFRTSIREFRTASLTQSCRNIARALRFLSPEQQSVRLDRRVQGLQGVLATLLGRRTATVLELHEIRKLSKASKYTLDVWQLTSKPTKESAQLTASLKDVYTHLGKWHDYRVTIDHLATFLKRETPRDLFDRAAYRSFLRELASGEAEHFNKYKKASKDLAANLKRWKPAEYSRSAKGPTLQPAPADRKTL